MYIKELKHCPFCGMEVSVLKTDDEGNLRSEDYFDAPYSGVAYHITHPYNNNTPSGHCPIATHEDEFIGCTDYYDIQELIAEWNKRDNDELVSIAVMTYKDECKASNTECKHKGWKCGVCDKVLKFAKQLTIEIEKL